MTLNDDNTWYAANITQVVVPPRQMLEAFEPTKVQYSLVSELMDNPGKTRIREGIIYSQRPSIVTPQSIDMQKLEGFGKKAQENANIIVQMEEMPRLVKYGLNFKKEEVHERVLDEPIENVTAKIKAEIENDDNLRTMIIGDDDLWEVSLLRFMVEYVQNSVPDNLQEFHADPRTALLLNPGGALQDEIEQDFLTSSGCQELIYKLGIKLRHNNLFEKYEDRFYALVRNARK